MKKQRVAQSSALLVMVAIVMLSACTSTPSARPTEQVLVGSTPAKIDVPASKAAASATARSGFLAYLSALNGVYRSGGRHVERLKEYVTAARYEEELDSAKRSIRLGEQVKGKASMSSFEIQDIDLGKRSANAYVCLDVSQTHVFAADGREITPKNRRSVQPFQVRLQGFDLVDTIAPWSGRNFC